MQLPDVVRSGVRREDLTGAPDWVDPLLRFVNTGIKSMTDALSNGLTLSDNSASEIQTVKLSHGVAQLVGLKRLDQAKGVRLVSVGSSDGKTQHALAFAPQLIGTSTPGQVKVVAQFLDTTAARVPVTLEFTPEGNYSAVTPKTLPSWTAPTLINSWVAYGSVVTGYCKDAMGRVQLKGRIKTGTIGTTAFTLPAGCRPADLKLFAVRGPGGTIATVQVGADGTVAPLEGTNTDISLDSVSFIGEQ